MKRKTSTNRMTKTTKKLPKQIKIDVTMKPEVKAAIEKAKKQAAQSTLPTETGDQIRA